MKPLGAAMFVRGPLDASAFTPARAEVGAGADLVIVLPAGRIGLNVLTGETARRQIGGFTAMVRAWGADEGRCAQVGRCTTMAGIVGDESLDFAGDVWPLLSRVMRPRDGLLLLGDRVIDADADLVAAAPGADDDEEDDDDDDDDDDLDDEVDGDPPDLARVVARLRVLEAVVERAFLESFEAPDPSESPGGPDRETFRARIVARLRAEGCWDEAEEGERALLETPIGALGERELVDATWRIEGIAVLAWALGGADLGPPDAQTDGRAALDAVPEARSLRSPDEVEALRQRLLTIHWRLVDLRLSSGPCDLAAVAARATWGPLTVAGLPMADGDLALGGRPVHRADPDLVRQATSIALERHRAVNWLCGAWPVFSEVPIDT